MNVGKKITMGMVGCLTWSLCTSALASDNAVIKGKVVFKGDTAKYKRTSLKTEKDPNCKKSKSKIGSYDVIINKKTDPMTLRNVIVFIEDGLGDRKYEVPSTPVKLTQFGCEYVPHVLGVMEGQGLQIFNGDDTNHNIHFLPKVNEEINFTQPKKDLTTGKTVMLKKEGAFKAKCDVHPWMGCYIQVFTHPFFAVTGKDGTFELKGLPAGKYTVVAWHEKFGTQEVQVEVAVDETKEADLTFAPK